MITIKTWQELNGCWYAMPLHKDYPNMFGVGLSAKIATKRVIDIINQNKDGGYNNYGYRKRI